MVAVKRRSGGGEGAGAWNVRGTHSAHGIAESAACAPQDVALDSPLLSHRVLKAAQVPLAPAGLVCVVGGGVCGAVCVGRRVARGCGVWGRGCVCREERLRARDHDDLIRRRPRTLRFRAARGARGKMVAVNPIHFVMAHGDVRAGGGRGQRV